MRIQKPWIRTSALVLAVLANSTGVFAQGARQEKPQAKSEPDVIIERDEIVIAGPGEGMAMPAIAPLGRPGSDTFVFVSSEMSFGGKVVKGAPYSAQAVTESIQTLSDGNRIVRKNTAAVYRDSEGRTRREQTLGAIGPFAAAGDPPQTFFINDPVAGVNYILEPRTRTARKLMVQSFAGKRPDKIPGAPPARGVAVIAPGAPPSGNVRVPEEVFMAPAPPPGAHAVPHREIFNYQHAPTEAKKESLGKQMIEGVEAEGTRATVTIAADEIGNELPIQIVTERWYSPELQTVVMTRHRDPRFGETIYRLTNINRSEPARTLFEVPSDYTVKEAPQPMYRTMRRRKPGDEK